jgi:hypothetical protein
MPFLKRLPLGNRSEILIFLLRATHMRTLIVAAVIGLATVTVVFPQTNNWKEDGLAGKVRSLTLERVELEKKAGSLFEGKRKPVETMRYTPEGAKIEETHYSSNGALLWTWVHAYGSDGRQRTIECRLANGSVSEKFVFAYNKDKEIERDILGPDGSLREKSSYAYDENGNNAEIDTVAADGTSVGKWAYQYDDRGHVREWAAYNADGSIFEESTYTYDSEGRLKVAAEYRADNSLEKKVTYDSKGNEIEAEKDAADGTLGWKRTYEYDFDSTGNWIKRTTKELTGSSGKGDFAAVEIEYRTIEYF